jgi:hypothetical protein
MFGRACSASGFVFGFRDLLWVLRGQSFIFGALYPSKSGLVHKHIVKHIGKDKVSNFKGVSSDSVS